MVSVERWRLEADISEAQEELRRLEVQLDDRPEFGHGRGAARAYAWEMALGRRQGLEARLKGLHRAMDKLSEGEYGRCERCGRSIDPERLEILPATTVCVKCARAITGRGQSQNPTARASL